MTAHADQSLLDMVSQTVSAYVSANNVPPEALPDVIRSVYTTFINLGQGDTAAIMPVAPKPAVPIKKSVFADYIICLEDGKKLKTLKRYLRTTYGMTLDDYRRRWDLPQTYPMVAPNYATERSAIAKRRGLGVKHSGRNSATPASVAEVDAYETNEGDEPQVGGFEASVRAKKKTLVTQHREEVD